MRRGVDIAIAILAVVGLIRPLDCLAATFTKQAAACCARGKCLPSANADDCCKGSVPAGKQLTTPKSPEQTVQLPAIVPVAVPIPYIALSNSVPSTELPTSADLLRGGRINLPLLI